MLFRYEVNKLNVPEIQQKFKTELRKKVNNADEQLQISNEKQELERKWESVKSSYNDTARELLGGRKRSSKPWISTQSWKLIEEKREIKVKKEVAQSQRLKEKWQAEYARKDREVKRSTRKDKWNWTDNI